MTLPTLHIPEHLPDWWLEADAQAQEGKDVTVNPTINQLVSGAYGEQPQEPQLTGLCQHNHGRSAEGKLLRCADCQTLYEPRNYSERSQVLMYGGGKSRKNYTPEEIYQHDLNTYHDGVYRR